MNDLNDEVEGDIGAPPHLWLEHLKAWHLELCNILMGQSGPNPIQLWAGGTAAEQTDHCSIRILGCCRPSAVRPKMGRPNSGVLFMGYCSTTKTLCNQV